ncbi:MAG: DNA methyltransferase [Ignavibacteria bacterium RBG_16_36_9]|nr:MAG: DNA methyltransferase [Ignavibacteria bacterium RBG_16_36_9]
MDIISILDNINSNEDLTSIKKNVLEFFEEVENHTEKIISYHLNGNNQSIRKELLLKELQQILDTKTIERTKYYLNRLIKSLSVQKEGKINDLNLNRWKEYDDIITDSLWIFDKRDTSGMHKAGYWGNFIPQIPNQLLRRYTKKGEWVFDPFLGSGTTLIECKRLGRNGIGIELNKQVAKATEENIKKEKNPFNVTTKVIQGNSGTINYKSVSKKLKVESFQFMIMHPPYWDIIRFSNNKDDLSNAKSTESFLGMFRKIIDNTYPILDRGRYCAVIIGDKYSAGEWIPLGFYVMQEMMKKGFKLKSTIIKNFDQTTAKRNQKELWRYRALAGGFYIFKHEYIFLFQK